MRIKVRWILVRLDFEESLRHMDESASSSGTVINHPGKGPSPNVSLDDQFPSKKEIFFCIHDDHCRNFGVGAYGEAQDIQGLF